MKKLLAYLLSLFLAITLLAGVPVQAKTKAKSKTLIPAKLTLRVSQVKSFKNKKGMKWSSDHPKIVLVKKGRLTAKHTGHAKVKLVYKKKSYLCKITVKKEIIAQKIAFSKKKITISKGAKKSLKIIFTPKNTTNKKLTFKASNKNVKVSKKGVVKALKTGKATITAIGAHKKKAVCQIVIKKAAKKPSSQTQKEPKKKEEEKKPKYSYTITPLLAPFNNYFYVKTENPDPTSFAFKDPDSVYPGTQAPNSHIITMEYCWNTHQPLRYADVKYENEATFRVPGGYIMRGYDIDGGTLNVENVEKVGYGRTYSDSGETVTCPSVEDSAQWLIDTYAKDQTDFFDQMDAIKKGLDSISVYPFVMSDDSQKGPFAYPFYTVAFYPELSLYENLTMNKVSDDEILMKKAYPFVLDSLGFPSLMEKCGKRLNPSAEFSYTNVHSDFEVTYNGVSKIYGGAGKGNSNSINRSQVGIYYTFDGGATDEVSHGSLTHSYETLMELKKVADDTAAPLRKQLSDARNNVVGTGAWIKALNTDCVNTAYAYVNYRYSGQNGSAAIADAFVDGRYVNNTHQFEQGATFAQHPHADIVLQNQTYQTVEGNTVHSDLIYRYDKKTDTWINNSYYIDDRYVASDEIENKHPLPDRFILTHAQVDALNVDQNTNSVPASGYIFDGTAAPGTSFTN